MTRSADGLDDSTSQKKRLRWLLTLMYPEYIVCFPLQPGNDVIKYSPCARARETQAAITQPRRDVIAKQRNFFGGHCCTYRKV
jgi:hypothetical protein